MDKTTQDKATQKKTNHDKINHDNAEKYMALCREVLKLQNININEEDEIKSFIAKSDVSDFFDIMIKAIVSRWEIVQQTQNTEQTEKEVSKSDVGDINKHIKTLDKRDIRLKRQSKEFSSYQELLDIDVDNVAPELVPNTKFEDRETEKQKRTETEKGTETKTERGGEIETEKSKERETETKKVTETPPIQSHLSETINSGGNTKIDETKKVTETPPIPSPSSETAETINRGDNAKIDITHNSNSNQDKNHYMLPIDFRLPNATVGKQYASGFTINSQIPSINLLNVEILNIKGLESTGLKFEPSENKYDKSKCIIKGAAQKSGEILLEIFFRLKTDEKVYKANSVFVINPDPRSLWKNIPSDKNIPFWKPDEDALELTTYESWKMVGASKRGRSHAHEGKCRDDHFLISFIDSTKWHILAVADGAGSALMSREGSRIAVTESAKILAEKLSQFDVEIVDAIKLMQPALKDISDKNAESNSKIKETLYKVFSLAVYEPVKVIHETVKHHNCQNLKNSNPQSMGSENESGANITTANSNGSSVNKVLPNAVDLKFRDFYTTLILAAHKEIDGNHFVASYWIGDGGIGLYNEGDYVKILGEGDSGEFAGQTRFLDNNAITKEDIYKRITFTYQDKMTALILMTDGITDPLFETDLNLNSIDAWDKMWRENIKQYIEDESGKTGNNLIKWLDFWSQGNHDDRTLVMLYR